MPGDRGSEIILYLHFLSMNNVKMGGFPKRYSFRCIATIEQLQLKYTQSALPYSLCGYTSRHDCKSVQLYYYVARFISILQCDADFCQQRNLTCTGFDPSDPGERWILDNAECAGIPPPHRVRSCGGGTCSSGRWITENVVWY